VAGVNLAGTLARPRERETFARLLRFLRFGIVGVSGVFVNEVALAVFVDRAGLNYLLGALLATQCSTVWNFALVEAWAFNDTQPTRSRGRRFAMFWGVNMFALVLRGPILAGLTSGLHVHYLISNLVSLAVLVVLRFFVADSWIWSGPRADANVGLIAREQLELRFEPQRSRLLPLGAVASMVGILAVGTLLRFWHLNQVGFNSDEAVYAGQGASIAGNGLFSPNFPIFRAHPLLFQTFLSFFFKTDVSDFMARACAVGFGLGTIVVTFLAARALFSTRVGVIASAFVAAMPYTVVVSRQVLLDGPMAFFVALAFYFVAKYALTQRPSWLWAGSAALGLAFLSKETSVVMLGAVYAFLALSPQLRVRWRDLSIAVALFVACALPYPLSLAFSGRTKTGNDFLLWQLFRRPNHGFDFYARNVPEALGYLVVIAAVIGIVDVWRQHSWRSTLLLTWIVVPVLFFQLWPVKGWQYLLMISGPVAILAAVPIAALADNTRWPRLRWWLCAAATLVVVASLSASTWDRITPSSSTQFLAGSGGVPGGRETGQWVARHVPEGARLLAVGPSMANIVMFYGHRDTGALSVSTNPLHRNPVYEPVVNPDRQIRTNEIQYLIWDAYSAGRTKHFSQLLLRYVDRYHGRAVYTAPVKTRTRDGATVDAPAIVVYEVRP
jgi:putative flippase GtrA